MNQREITQSQLILSHHSMLHSQMLSLGCVSTGTKDQAKLNFHIHELENFL